LNAALDYLSTVGFDVVVVYALDRLARDPYIRRTIEIEFEKYGAKVEYVLGNYEDSPEGEVRKDLDAIFAKWENAKRVERCNRGKRRKAEAGLFVGGRAPYGYGIDKDALGGLAVHEGEAETVRLIFELYAREGKSMREICRILTESEATSHSGNNRWAHSSIGRILYNTIYVGRGYYNKHMRNGGSLEERKTDEWIEFKTTPIVDRDVFAEAQERRARNKRLMRRRPSRFYLLSGMIFCGTCGRPYVSQTQLAGKQRRKNEAQAYRHRKRAGHCSNHWISARLLEPVVWSEVVKILLDPEQLRRGYKDSLEEQAKQTKRQRAHLETLGRQLVSLEQKRYNLTTAYVDPDIQLTKQEYIEQKVLIDTEHEALQRKIARIEDQLARVPTPASLETLDKFASEIRRRLKHEDAVTPQMKRKILDQLHVKITINPDRSFRIDGWFGAGVDGLSYTTCRHLDDLAQSPRPTPWSRALQGRGFKLAGRAPSTTNKYTT
jgi:site-specific DNA recombinase